MCTGKGSTINCSSVGQERINHFVTGHTYVVSRGVWLKNQCNNLFQHGDSGFTEKEDEDYCDDDDDDTENCEIACERILSWRTEGTYEVIWYVRLDMNP